MRNLYYYILSFTVCSVLPIPVYWSNKRGGFYYCFMEDIKEDISDSVCEIVRILLPLIRRFAFVSKKRAHKFLLGTLLEWNGTRIDRHVLFEDLTKDR